MLLIVARLLRYDDEASAELLNESLKKGNKKYLAATLLFAYLKKRRDIFSGMQSKRLGIKRLHRIYKEKSCLFLARPVHYVFRG
jgi:hypothetical protein